MDAIIDRVCGLDIHKEEIMACARLTEGANPPTLLMRAFPAHLQGLMSLKGWLIELKVKAVAMESTGIYWRPVYSILEVDRRWKMIVGNAMHMKNLPGRKTDVKDAQWIAELASHGLVPASFVPPPRERELRDLIRSRASWVRERTQSRNRVLKILQSGGVKLDGVASDAFGKSGQLILHALAEGKATPSEMAQLAQGVMRKKIDALTLALESKLSELHREMLKIALTHLENLETCIAKLDDLIDRRLAPYSDQMERLMTIPGVERVAAATIIAELGTDMSVFPTSGHAASWTGICPGNHESAGKRTSGRPSQGNRSLKTALVQAANGAARTKRGYLRGKFQQLKANRGYGRAIVAIGHKILIAAYHILRDGTVFRDIVDKMFLTDRKKKRMINRLIAKLHELGFMIPLDVIAAQFEVARA